MEDFLQQNKSVRWCCEGCSLGEALVLEQLVSLSLHQGTMEQELQSVNLKLKMHKKLSEKWKGRLKDWRKLWKGIVRQKLLRSH
jgi:hypothetical protein